MLVIFRIGGGVGNQLFQYSYSLKVAADRGVAPKYIIDRMPGERRLSLDDVLPEALEIPSPWQRSQLSIEPEATGIRGLGWKLAGQMCRIIPDRAGYHQRPAECVDRVQLPSTRRLAISGYFQHPSCYEPFLDDVCEQVASTAPGGLIVEDSIAVCFRRREFIEMGWALPIDYYDDALASIDPDREAPLRIVGDDAMFNAAMSERFRSLGWTVDDVPRLCEDPALNDFWAMASARQLIAANSTFSWWAGVVGDVLADANLRTVVIPDPWLPDFPTATEALLRPRWAAIPVRQTSS